MALIESCFCISLFTATIVSGVITMVLYLLGFALELWWIIEVYGNIHPVAFILCTGYFAMFFLSVTMIAGIIGQKTRFILLWIFFIMIFFLPEAGFVIYMSVFKWTLSRTNGIVELLLWIFRATVNILSIVIVQSQCSMWRDEKQVMKQLHSLKMQSPVLTNSIHMKNSKSLTNDAQPLQGYENLGFTSITDMHPPTVITSDDNLLNENGRIQRSLSSASQLQIPQKTSLYGGSLPGTQIEDNRWPSSGNFTTFGHNYSQMNESDVIDYNRVVFPIDSNIELDPKSAVQLHSYRPRSLMYLDEDDYLTRPPPSRAVSMNYVNVHSAFSTQSLDRAKYFPRGDRKMASLDFLDMTRAPDVRLQKLPMKPFDYLNRPGSKQSDIDNISDDARKIGDVAL